MSKKLSITDLSLKDKRVLIRVDFNVPQDELGHITDDTRIIASLPTIQHVIDQGGKAILMSHLGRPQGIDSKLSLKPCADKLSQLLKKPVLLATDCIGKSVSSMISQMKSGDIVLLENLRFYPAEEKPDTDPTFAKELSQLGDVYINDAFGTAHRKHSSTAIVAQYFPKKSAAGFLLQKEIDFLGHALSNPARPFMAIIGGAKISSKIGVIKSLMQKIDALFIGGAMAYTFLKAKGFSIGDSICENSMIDTANQILREFSERNIPLYLPKDITAATDFNNNAKYQTFNVEEGIPKGYQGMDIGPATTINYIKELQEAKTIFWNGPLGVCELSHFAKGTQEIARALSNMSNVIKIVGGGDSIAAIQQLGLSNGFSHLSTGGGASLEYIELRTLPGIEALSDKT